MNCNAGMTEERCVTDTDVRVRCFDRESECIYDKKFREDEWNMYKLILVKRYEILMEDCGKLSSPYVMFEAGRRMYRLDDLEYVKNFRKMRRSVEPIDYDVEESFNFDLMMDCSLYDFFPHPEGRLVYRFGRLYINGMCLGTPVECWQKVGLPSGSFKIDLDYGSGEALKIFLAAIEEFYKLEITEFEGLNCSCYYGKKESR